MFSIEEIKRRVLLELRDDPAFRRAFATLIVEDLKEVMRK